MASVVQLEPSKSPYRLSVTLGKWNVTFRMRWNPRDGRPVAEGGTGGAWYFHMYDDDNTVIVAGVKLVLGVNLGRRSNHAFFDDWFLRAFDSSDKGKDATFDDAARRVQLVAIDPRDPHGAE